jgi:MHS family proline/betaine transporter-like MFS transporter
MTAIHISPWVAAAAYPTITINTIKTQVGAYALLQSLSEDDVRYTGVATGWNLGVVVAGGSAPFIAVWLVENTGNYGEASTIAAANAE